MIRRLGLAALAVGLAAASASHGQARNWSALTADRVATQVGDSLTVIVQENASAANTAQSTTRRSAQLAAEAARTDRPADGGQLALKGQYAGDGSSGRSDRVAAQISVSVVEVLRNGDLRVAGEQTLRVNGQVTRISVSGRARPTDISASNTIVSNRLSEASIVYDGEGQVARSGRPGVLARVLSLF